MLSPYLKKYELDIKDFPFRSNVDVEKILEEDFSSDIDESLDVNHIKDMHLYFFQYAVYIETCRILDVINFELSEFSIFKSSITKKKFEDLLKYLDIKDDKKRGNKVKLVAIYKRQASRKFFFKESAELSTYFNYINEILDSKFTTKSYSYSEESSHELVIENWIKENCL